MRLAVLRLFPLLFVALLALVGARAEVPADFAPEPPRIPAREFSAADLGVHPGSAKPVTEALQKAIDRVSAAGGGKLVLPAGDYLCGPLTLPSRLDLHLAKGAAIRLLAYGPDYPTSNNRYTSLLNASGATDIRVSGEGLIDGRGEPWWRAFRAKELTLRRPQLVSFERCERVEFSDFSTLNPPNTHFALRLCREVTMRRLTLAAPDESPNTDGINVSGKNYLIERCNISTGDDNIVVLTPSAPDWPAPVCENFLVRDCALGFGHGLSIGSYTGGGIRGLRAERVTFDGTTGGVRLKADRDRGGLVEDLVYRDLTMRGVKHPVYLSSYYPKDPKSPDLDAEPRPITEKTPRWKNILIEDLDATDCENSVVVWGLPEQPFEDLVIRRARISSKRGARFYYAGNITLDARLDNPADPAADYWPAQASPRR